MNRYAKYMLLASSATLISACRVGDLGSSAAPPTNVAAVAGDGRATITFTGVSGVEYWLFGAADAAMSVRDWVTRAGGFGAPSAASPQTVCGLTNDTQYWFSLNGRTGGGPGGDGSPLVTATPRQAGTTWTANAAATTSALNSAATVILTNCATNRVGLTTTMAAVGAAGTLLTSGDGITWTKQGTPAGFTGDLHGVAGYVANVGNTTTPGLRWVAVGDGGSSVYSTDGTSWSVGVPVTTGRTALRAVTQISATFLAVGDGGVVYTTTDGISWSARASATAANLLAVTYGNGRYVAVGDNGVVVASTDGSTWGAQNTGGTATLRSITYNTTLNTFVAVGDKGAVAVSSDGGVTWTARTAGAGTQNLVGVGSTTRFVAIDTAGATYTSADGLTWATGAASGLAATRALGNTGFGYLALGAAGAMVRGF